MKIGKKDKNQHNQEPFLVFEYAPNGMLRDWISGKKSGKSLSWSQRIAAAIGIVKGIQFLHTGIVPRMLSSNLKITDVLLDQNFSSKISCYNLPLLDQNTEKDGVQGYFNRFKEPSERFNNPEKLDVYDFGIILLEIITGKPLRTQKEVETVKEEFHTGITADDAAVKDMVDPAVRDTCSEQSLTTVAEICRRCLVDDSSERPSVEDMLWNSSERPKIGRNHERIPLPKKMRETIGSLARTNDEAEVRTDDDLGEKWIWESVCDEGENWIGGVYRKCSLQKYPPRKS